MEAEREVADLQKCAFMRGHVGEVFAATVTGAAPFGLWLTLDEHFVEGLVHVSTLPEFVEFDERHHAFAGSRSGERFGLGDRFDVRRGVGGPDPGAHRLPDPRSASSATRSEGAEQAVDVARVVVEVGRRPHRPPARGREDPCGLEAPDRGGRIFAGETEGDDARSFAFAARGEDLGAAFLRGPGPACR